MRPITLISALLVSLHLLPGTAAADSGGGPWTWPIRGPVITPYLNGSDPYAAGQHRGVDIAAPSGTRVVAATAGTITFAGVVGSSGLTVAERTADGRLDLSYLHLGSAGVHRGDAVAAGEPVGTVGTSGQRSAERPHLHFGIRTAGSRTAYHDPLDFLPPPPAGRTPDPAPAPVPVAAPATPQPTAATLDGTAAPQPVPALPALHGLPAHQSGPAHAHAPANAAPAPAMPAAHAPGAPAPPLLTTTHGHPVAAPPARGPMHHDPRRHTHPPAPNPLTGPAAHERQLDGHAEDPERLRNAPARHRGLNLGWLAACLGLIAAATALGHPDATRKLTARGRARIDAALRPAARRS